MKEINREIELEIGDNIKDAVLALGKDGGIIKLPRCTVVDGAVGDSITDDMEAIRNLKINR